MNRSCKFGNYCRREHPEICKRWLEKGRCENINDTCTFPHPTICISHIKREICYRRNCGLVHPKNRLKTYQRPQEKRTWKPWQNNKIINNQRTDMGKDDFLGNQHAPMDMGRIVTDLVSAVKRMNTSIERLERREIKRWIQ